MSFTYRAAVTRGAGLQQTGAEKAKVLVAEAFATRHKSKRLTKAHEALRLSPACAEAYIVLAGLEGEHGKKVELLEKGIEIASKSLDNSRFLEPDGYFWQEMITRPYMRCRTALAQTLWEMGDKRMAILHLKEILRLNPYDNQGIRFHLLSWMLEFDVDAPDVDDYCKEYESDESAFVKYACLLWKFARHGAGEHSRRSLEAATEVNEFVPAILCGRAKRPILNNARVERRTPQEAIAYECSGGRAWHGVAGALDWLAESCPHLLNSKRILQEIAMAKEFKVDGQWAEPIPIEILRITD